MVLLMIFIRPIPDQQITNMTTVRQNGMVPPVDNTVSSRVMWWKGYTSLPRASAETDNN